MLMRLILPGGAVLTLDGKDDRAVACRPIAAVRVRMVPVKPAPTPPSPRPPLRERLTDAKLVIEVLLGLVGLIAAILALFGWSRQ